jgi:hypothetical protein
MWDCGSGPFHLAFSVGLYFHAVQTQKYRGGGQSAELWRRYWMLPHIYYHEISFPDHKENLINTYMYVRL